MHFHLPKPLHGWREFTGEVGIIVIGVLIALGAEQLVETMHWRGEAKGAKAALRQETDFHYFAAAELVIAAPCIDRQLQSLEQGLTAPGPAVPAPLYRDRYLTFTFRAPSRSWGDDAWRSVVSSGVASHFDQQSRDDFGAYYSQVGEMHDNARAADVLASKLRVLSQPIGRDPETVARLVEEIEEERGHFDFMHVVGNQIIGHLQEMGTVTSTEDMRQGLSQSGTLQFCRAHHLPLGKIEPDHD